MTAHTEKLTQPTDIDRDTLRAFARLVAAHHELADTVEPLARDIVRDWARRSLDAWAAGTVGDHHGDDRHAAARLERLARHGALVAARDLAARVRRDVAACRAPRPLITDRLVLDVDVTITARGMRTHLGYEDASGPPWAATAVRMLEAGARGDTDTVAVLSAAEQHLSGRCGLVGVVDVLAELGAALGRKDTPR